MRKAGKMIGATILSIVVLSIGIFQVYSTGLVSHRKAAVKYIREQAETRTATSHSSSTTQNPRINVSYSESGASTIAEFSALIDSWEAWCIENRDIWGNCCALEGSNPSSWTDDEFEMLKSVINDKQDMLQQIRDLSGRGVPLTKTENSHGYLDTSLCYSFALNISLFMQLETLVYARDRDMDAVRSGIETQLQFINAMSLEPSFDAQGTSWLMKEFAMRGIRESLVPHSISIAQATETAERISTYCSTSDITTCLSLEMPRWIESYDGLRDGQNWLPSDIGFENRWLHESPIGGFFINIEAAATSDYMVEILEASELPYYQARPVFNNLLQDAQSLPFYKAVTCKSIPFLIHIVEYEAKLQAIVGLTQVGLLIDAYNSEYGVYPSTLDDIEPFLGSMPMDPFSGNAFRYIPSEDTYSLYSVGFDGVDDGGVMADYQNDLGAIFRNFESGDITWRSQRFSESEQKDLAYAL